MFRSKVVEIDLWNKQLYATLGINKKKQVLMVNNSSINNNFRPSFLIKLNV